MNENDYVEALKSKMGLTKQEIEALVQEKIEDYKGNIARLAAFSMVYKDFNLKQKNTKKEVIKPMENEKIETERSETPVREKMELSLVENVRSRHDLVPIASYPSEDEIRFLIKRKQFVKETLINENDWVYINKKKHLTISAWQKYINAFGISIEILSKKVYEDGNNVIAEYRVKAIAPTGQFVEADGTKTKQEYWRPKEQDYAGYTLHALKAWARTRAIKIATANLVGYGEDISEK